MDLLCNTLQGCKASDNLSLNDSAATHYASAAWSTILPSHAGLLRNKTHARVRSTWLVPVVHVVRLLGSVFIARA